MSGAGPVLRAPQPPATLRATVTADGGCSRYKTDVDTLGGQFFYSQKWCLNFILSYFILSHFLYLTMFFGTFLGGPFFSTLY